MSTSKLTLYFEKPVTDSSSYHHFKLQEQSNEIIEDLEEYLTARANSTVINNFMYLKIKLDLDIKVELDQSYSHASHDEPLVYVKVEEDDETFYYFVSDFEWISEAGVRLKLHLDVLNTFTLGEDYEFGSGTIVHRQHFNRWKIGVNSGSVATVLERAIDIYPEEINAALYKIDEKTIYDYSLRNDNKEGSFALVFQNQNDPSQAVTSPVNIFLVPEYDMKIEGFTDIDSVQAFTPETLSNDYLESHTWLLPDNFSSTHSGTVIYLIDLYSPQHPTDEPPVVVLYDTDGNETTYDFNQLFSDFGKDNTFISMLVARTSTTSFQVALYSGAVNGYSTIGFSSYGPVSNVRVIGIETGRSDINPRLEYGCDLRAAGSSISTTINFRENYDDFSTLVIPYFDHAVLRGFAFGAVTTSTISDLDRTNTKYIKMLLLPYSPAEFNLIEGLDTVYRLPDGWQFKNINEGDATGLGTKLRSALGPVDQFVSLSREITMDHYDKYDFSEENCAEFLVNPINECIWHGWSRYILGFPYNFFKQNVQAWNRRTLGNEENPDEHDQYLFFLESKLYNSAFRYKKIVYDSFSYVFKYEEIKDASAFWQPEPGTNLFYEDPGLFPITFKYRISSSGSFVVLNTFDQYEKKLKTEDYDNVMIINRNNDIPLYSSDYLTYLMTGYNYDVKAKNLNVAQQSVSILTNAFEPGKLANPASMVSGVVKGITSTIFSELQAENNLSKTLTDKQFSTESINGSDDLDLLRDYTNDNKYKLVTYEIPLRLKYLVTKYFMLCGYGCNFYGKPDLESRQSFNYAEVEADLEWKRYVSKDIVDELVNKWRAGVFKVHHRGYIYSSSSSTEWDDGLDTANIETFLFDL